MKEKPCKILPLVLMFFYVASLCSCKGTISSVNQIKSVIFHIGESTQEVDVENNVFKAGNTAQEHRRFIGWSTDQSKEHIVSRDEEVKKEDIQEYFLNKASLDLYAIYADILKVSFVLENTTTYELDSDLENRELVPSHSKQGFAFEGWSKTKDGTTIDLGDVATVSYAGIAPIANGAYEISFYPIYSERVNSIALYNYSTADEMAEIHIATANGLAIDDASLIKPDEHKGKDGEIVVYDYVGANITVSHCEDKYAMDAVPGKVKVRGNYTSTYAKKPIRIKFDSKQKMLGLNNDNKYKSWVLLANWKDTSLLRDASAFYLGNALVESDGYYTSDFRFVKVYLNDSYNGVYLLVEQQELGATRVNIPESKNAEDTEKTGYFLEFDGYYKNEPDNQRFTVSFNDVKTGNNGCTVSNDIMNNNQYNFVKKVTQNIWNVVYDATKKSHTDLAKNSYHTIDDNGDYVSDTTITNAKDAVSRVIDINSLINMYILHDILQDRDIGFSSFYFALDFSSSGNHKLAYTAPWDFDYAVGNNTFENAMRANLNTQKLISDGRLTYSGRKYKLKNTATLSKEDFSFTNKDGLYCQRTDNPWFVVFSNEQWLWDMIYARWNEAKEKGLFTGILKMIDTMTSKYEADYNENFTKWSQSLGITLSAMQPDIVTYFVNQKQAAQYLHIWLEARLDGLSNAYKNKASK